MGNKENKGEKKETKNIKRNFDCICENLQKRQNTFRQKGMKKKNIKFKVMLNIRKGSKHAKSN